MYPMTIFAVLKAAGEATLGATISKASLITSNTVSLDTIST